MESEPFQPFVSALGLTDTFTLKLYPRGTREGSDTHVSMVLSWKDIQMFGSEVLFTIHLFGNRTGQCIKSKNTWHTFRADAHELGWMKFIRLDTVEHALRAQEPQGMSIRLEVSFCSPGCHIDMSAALTAPAAPDKRANANMWGDELLSDCIVRARDGSSYRQVFVQYAVVGTAMNASSLLPCIMYCLAAACEVHVGPNMEGTW